MKRFSLLPILAAVVAAAPGVSGAETVHGSYVPANPSLVDVTPEHSHNSNIIYLNGCFGTGCDITPGNESSIDDTSSIIDAPHHIPSFSGGPMEWDAIVDCVRDTYQPFDIVITDQDPGNVPHFEAIVAGEASDVGLPGLIGGVAPFMCGETINNAITYSFSELVENDVAETCWVIAQETAHAFGLDHEYLCSDPMSYLRSCDNHKRFQDEAAPCGEFEARACSCGGATQNSFRRLLDHFGPGVPTPPTIRIDSPSDGEQVEPGFVVRTSASDDLRIDRVELRINSVAIASSESEPYVFNVPTDISEGRLRIEVTAFDNYDYQSTQVIEVVQGEPCTRSAQCGDLEACVSGRCVPGPEAEGGLGQACREGDDCASGQCGRSDDGDVCTETCAGAGSCPAGFGCLETASDDVCWPGYADDEGCSVCGGGTRGAMPWFLVLIFLGLRRRRLLG